MLRGHDHAGQDDDQQRLDGRSLRPVELLEAPVAERRHHEQRDQIGDDGHADAHPARELFTLQQNHQRARHGGAGRNGQADEIALVGGAGDHVEARQTQGAADHEQKRREPRGAPEIAQRERVEQERRRHSERDEVGQRVVLDAELARGLHETRHAAIQHVHDHRHENGERRFRVAAVHRQQQREEAAEQVGGREQARQQERALVPPFAQLVPRTSPRPLAPVSPWNHGRTVMVRVRSR